MIKFLPLLLAIGYGIVMMQFSAWRTRQTLTAQSRPLRDEQVMALADQLAVALELPAVKVNVLDVPAVNGLAAPDGQIYLTRGFLEAKARGDVSAEELASVIAHELGHVALGHGRRRMIDFTGQNAAFMMLSAVLNRFLPGLGVMIANVISRALMAKLSRRDEFEADAYASALLVKAGIGTGVQKSLFAKLERLVGGSGGTPAWLMSHPATAERIAAIEVNEGKWRLAQA
jgi:metalloprotease